MERAEIKASVEFLTGQAEAWNNEILGHERKAREAKEKLGVVQKEVYRIRKTCDHVFVGAVKYMGRGRCETCGESDY